ncbi:MAG TPA: hypothetical protein VL443_26250 [Cyclobacteriaceae bacterium]|jgi:hypothetical protein|nr:hypothetical protein [Cyclobacteriaceae bacterium]
MQKSIFHVLILLLLSLGSLKSYAQIQTQDSSRVKSISDEINSKGKASKTHVHKVTTKTKNIASQTKQKIKSTKAIVPDSLVKISNGGAREQLKKSAPKPDDVSVSYQDGKLKLPEKLPQGVNTDELSKLKNGERSPRSIDQSKDQLAELKKDADVKDLTNVDALRGRVASGLNSSGVSEMQHRVDSISQVVGVGESLLIHPQGPIVKRVYSDKIIKRIYDSLGMSHFDTLMTLASKYNEVSKGDMLKALNVQEPNLPIQDDKASLGKLVSNAAGNDIPKTMPDLPGMGDLKNNLPDLGSMKLPGNVLSELPPIHGYQIPEGKYPWLDSLRKANLDRQKLKLKEEETSEKVKSVVAEKYARFWDRAFIDGVVSYLKQNESNTFQLAPSLGYHITPSLSVGLGPNIKVIETNNKWNALLGYRLFTKAEFYHQRASVQFEDLTNPARVTSESINKTQHSLLAGVGYQLPISSSLFIQVAMLYRVNNNQYAGGHLSPWVFRIGLSSYKNSKH